MSMTPAFATVVLDVDSTVSGVEGIDWLAARRGPDVAAEVAALTANAMRGAVPLEDVYKLRLAKIRPRRDDVDGLARAYVDAMAPDCAATVAELRAASVSVVLVSGGIRNALMRLALELDLDLDDLHAVDIHFDPGGAYTGFDERSPLATSEGKRGVVAALGAERPTIMVGDGITDLAARPVVDCFAAFTGFVAREAVTRQADVVLQSFRELGAYVLKETGDRAR